MTCSRQGIKRRDFSFMIMCLVLGAMMNVAVAWACARWSRADWSEERIAALDDSLALWTRFAPPTWPRSPTDSGEARGFGLVVDSMIHQQFIEPSESENGGLDIREWFVIPFRCGWPMLALSAAACTSDLDPGHNSLSTGFQLQPGRPGLGTQYGGVNLPYGPVWPGILVNTFFYAGAIWLLLHGLLAMRQRRRELRKCCGACGYPHGVSPVCTECGVELSKT